MAITRRTDYAVRLMYELAQLPPGATLSMRDLCDAAGVPESFGTSLVAFLRSAWMVRAEGCREHQFSLARPPYEITMAEIIRACEPDFSLSPCADEPDSCTRTPHCGVRKMWSSLDSLIWQQLDVLSLADVVNGTSAQRAIVGSSATARDADLVGIS